MSADDKTNARDFAAMQPRDIPVAELREPIYVGSSARMITAMVERVIAGDSADSVVRDYKWEWDATPDLSPIENLRIALAASQATVKELRDRLKAFIAWRTEDGLPLRHVVEITEEVVYAEAALARTDDMGALEAFAKEIGATAWDYGFVDRGALEACGKVSITAEQHAERRTADVAAIVARLMRRAGEAT